MVDGQGNPVNALYGFARFLGDFMEQVRPQHIAVLFDESSASSYRTQIYPEYKANRNPTPPELKRQFAQCRRVAGALGLLEWAQPGYEADDLIGTLVMEGREKGIPSTVVTRDKDLAQLISKDDIFWDFAGKGKVTYNQIPDYFDVWPEQVADFLALAGDAADNIKGVPGVGKKTATALLQHFGSIENLYDSLDSVHEVNVRGAKSLGQKLANHKDDALLARRLTGIICDAPIEQPSTGLRPTRPDLGNLNALYDEAGIGMALRRQAERVSDLV
jgi:5'-3' exonuclease